MAKHSQLAARNCRLKGQASIGLEPGADLGDDCGRYSAILAEGATGSLFEVPCGLIPKEKNRQRDGSLQ